METWTDVALPGNGRTPDQERLAGPQIIEAIERDISNPEPFVLELSAATPFFEAYGSVEVHVGPRLITFKVRTVPHDLLHRASMISKPRVPKVRDSRTGVWSDDTESYVFQQWDQNYAYLKVLLGLVDVRLTDQRGQAVWVSTTGQDDTAAFALADMSDTAAKTRWAQKFRLATKALKDMRITIGHVNAILTAIDDLSRAEQAHQEEEAERTLGESV